MLAAAAVATGEGAADGEAFVAGWPSDSAANGAATGDAAAGCVAVAADEGAETTTAAPVVVAILVRPGGWECVRVLHVLFLQRNPRRMGLGVVKEARGTNRIECSERRRALATPC